MLIDINGANPSAQYDRGWWASYTSTSDGTPAGDPSSTWTFANVGDTAGPVAVDQAYLYREVEDYMLPTPDPVPTLAQLKLNQGTTVVTVPPSTTHGSADAGVAAAWLAAQLKANDDVLPNAAGTATDWGLTIDAVFALASAGVGADQISATAAKLYASDTAYLGSWGSEAKMIVGLEVVGLDPTAFPTAAGPRNLIAELRSVLNADGSFGAAGSDFAFTHAIAMLALARTDGGVPQQAVSWLQAQQCTDKDSNTGAYAAPYCDSADVDSTAMAIQALKAAEDTTKDPGVALAEKWVASQQNAQGSFINAYGDPSTNTAGLAAQALPDNKDLVSGAVGFIGGLQITCDDAATQAGLADYVGAIAAGQTGFDTALKSGIAAGDVDQFLRATTQAVLGLGGPDFAALTAQGASKSVPDRTCTPTSTPSASPSASASATPSAPAGNESSTPQANTGGTAQHSDWIWLAPVFILMGAAVMRRAVTR